MAELECIPYAVGHADEGVCLLLKIGPYRVLLDCGLVDGRSLPLSGDWAQTEGSWVHPHWPADLVLCSHAHPDHAQGLLDLHTAYPQLPIFSSAATAQLLPLNWLDQGDRNLDFCQPLPWRIPTEVIPQLTVELYPAGHLPGAAAFLLTYTPSPSSDGAEARPYTVFYTGDFLLSNSRLVDGLPLNELRGLNPDVLILEGSFGTARYPHRRQQETQCAERILKAIRQGQSVLLPVPVLGLAQELLMLMRSHHTFTGKDVEIWVEEPIAQACDAYLALLPHLPPTVQNFAQHQPLFWDDRIRPRVRRLTSNLRSPIAKHPCIVLASETTDVAAYCCPGDHDWLVLWPQYPPQRHPSAEPVFEPEATPYDVNLERWQFLLQTGKVSFETYLLAEHCDGPSTTQLIHNLRPQHVVFVHGSPAYLADLTSLDELANRYHLHSPGAGKRLELPVGDGLIQTIAPSSAKDTVFEGEVYELDTEIRIALPLQLQQDPRWRNFIDTGLIEASWQGETLILRSISQRELLAAHYQALTPQVKCCGACKHYKGQRCWNQRSTLYSFKVSPDGYCPAFEANPPVSAE